MKNTNQNIEVLDDLQIDQFIKVVNQLCGVDLVDKKNTLSIRLPKFLEELGLTISSLLVKIKIDKTIQQKVLNFITINETYFLRETQQLEEIIRYVKSLERKANILSAPCSTGEEVYSLEILAVQNFIKDIYILGVDINSDAIKKAEQGKYRGRSLNNLSTAQKNKFFKKKADDDPIYTIDKTKLYNHQFRVCNMISENDFLESLKFDVILSRNMIIYFDYDSKLKVLENFHKILADDGRLYVGTADLIPENDFFKKVFSPKGTYYEKL